MGNMLRISWTWVYAISSQLKVNWDHHSTLQRVAKSSAEYLILFDHLNDPNLNQLYQKSGTWHPRICVRLSFFHIFAGRSFPMFIRYYPISGLLYPNHPALRLKPSLQTELCGPRPWSPPDIRGQLHPERHREWPNH